MFMVFYFPETWQNGHFAYVKMYLTVGTNQNLRPAKPTCFGGPTPEGPWFCTSQMGSQQHGVRAKCSIIPFALFCIVLHCFALFCNHFALFCKVLHHFALFCNSFCIVLLLLLLHVANGVPATWGQSKTFNQSVCIVLHHSASFCIILHSNILHYFALFCIVLHCFAMFCNVLQCFATFCIVLQFLLHCVAPTPCCWDPNCVEQMNRQHYYHAVCTYDFITGVIIPLKSA